MADDKPEDVADASAHGADAPDPTGKSGTETEDERNAGGDDSENIKRLNLEWKAKAERTNELEREVAELKARQPQPPGADDDKGGDERDEDEEAYRAEVTAYAANRIDPSTGRLVKGDPVAKGMVRQWEKDKERDERENRLLRALDAKDQLDDIEDKSERKEVREHYIAARKQGRPLPDIAAAKAEVREKKQAARIDQLEKELARRKATEADEGQTPAVTHAREVSAKETKVRQMTRGQFLERQGTLSNEKRLEEQADLRAGRIVYKKG